MATRSWTRVSISVYSEGPARVAAEIQALAGMADQTLTLVLTSADVADTSEVNVLIVGRRQDPYIFTRPLGRQHGPARPRAEQAAARGAGT